ncbi:MAG: AzlC family ABC transporter permease [Clostridiales bacterium]|nr:AzlC family ABC transporter permease [Clostridiales bacterium]
MQQNKITATKNASALSTLSFKKGLKDGLPIGLGYFPVAFAFGVQASIAGVPLIMSLFISMTNLTSAGQLAGLSIIASCGTILEMILTQLVINSRYFLMSITLTQKLDGSFSLGHRFLCSAFVTDEIFAVASSKPKTFGRKYFYGLVILPYLGWSLGTLFGSFTGDVLPPVVTSALGIALYAMFIAIIIPPSIYSRGVFPAVALGALISCALYFIPIFDILSTGICVIISAIITALIIALIFPVKEEEVQS